MKLSLLEFLIQTRPQKHQSTVNKEYVIKVFWANLFVQKNAHSFLFWNNAVLTKYKKSLGGFVRSQGATVQSFGGMALVGKLGEEGLKRVG